MALTDSNNMVMPVAPVGNYGMGDGFGMNGGNAMFWFVILILAIGGGWGNNRNNNSNSDLLPFLMANNSNSSATTTANDVQRGFDQQAIMSGINANNNNITTGFSGVNQAICNSTAGITAAINNGFAQNEISNNARQMADMQQNFALSQQLAQCCCDNRLATANLTSTVLAENCSDRNALAQSTQQILTAITDSKQQLLTQMCNDKIDEKNDRIRALENQNTLMTIRAEALANRNAIIADNLVQTNTLENYLNNGYNSCCNGCR